MLDPHLLGFRPLTMEDLPLLHRWINQTPEVKEFWAYGAETPLEAVLAKYGPRIRGEQPTSPYLILYADRPIGYIQRYLWRDYGDVARAQGLAEESAGLDLFIGDPAYLHQGLGPHILRTFLKRYIFADPSVESCLLLVETRNASALRGYAKAGFVALKEIPDLDGEPGPVYLLRVGRTAMLPPAAGPAVNPAFGALRAGPIVLYRITEQNADHVRSLLRDQPPEIRSEFEASYLPEYDEAGRQTLFGFYATLHGELAGLSLLAVDSWKDGRGCTGADTLPHMRGRGVAPGSKPHLFYLAFELLGLNRVETGCFVSNLASKRSLEKTPGLRFEGVLREYGRNDRGEYEDELRYAILRSDWLRLYREQRVEVLPEERP